MGNQLQISSATEGNEQVLELETIQYVSGTSLSDGDLGGGDNEANLKSESCVDSEIEGVVCDIRHGKMEKQPICIMAVSQTCPTGPTGPDHADMSVSEIVETRWKMRYFILKRGAIVYYNIDYEQMYDMSLVIGVELGELCFTLPGLSGYKILLQFSNGDLLTFAVPLKKQALEWLEAFRQAAEQSKAANRSVLASSEIDRHCLLFFLESGENWFNRWEQWVIRSVSLQHQHPHSPMISLVIRSLTRLGHFPLSHSTVVMRAGKGSEGTLCAFHVKSRVVGGLADQERILTLRCENSRLCDRWMKSISESCGHDVAPGNHVRTADGAVVEFYNLLHDVLETGKSLKWQPMARRRLRPDNNTADNNDNENDLFFILSIDGGGTRGIIPCILLERLLQVFPNLLSRINMVAGTSNGAMVAAALAFGHNPHTIREMIQLISQAVFSDQRGGRYTLSAAKWSNRFLALFCQEVWKETKMSEAEIELLIPAFLLNNNVNCNADMETRVFTTTTKPGDGDGAMGNAQKCDDLIRDVLMRSCAAPIYFPSWQNYVDGGVFAHSPADLAVTHAVSTLSIPLEKICVLSISTGTVREAIVDETTTATTATTIPSHDHNDQADICFAADGHNYGYYQWASRLPKVVWRGMTDKTSHICQQLLGNRFFRLDPRLEQDLALDQAELLPAMISCGESHDMQDVISWSHKMIPQQKNDSV